MDKNIIKNHLSKRFLSEETTPGISVTDKAKKESEKINKAGVKAIETDVTTYDKALKKEAPDKGKMAINKYNYTDEAEKTYHEEMEILNGQEMIEYSSEPGEEFKKRAEESLEGSSRMGNAIGGNAEETWGASKDSFGKDLVRRVKDSSKKRAEAEIQTYGMGDVQIPTGNKVQVATTAVAATKPKGDTTKVNQSVSEKPKTKVVKEDNNNNNKPQIKESMKRLKFNNEFKGVNTTQKIGHALTLIPENYRVDSKEFEMTDGVVTCKVRWEGNLNEGKAVVLIAADKTKINEDMERMKSLMGYKSQETLGLVKGNARIDENKVFGDIWKKSRVLLGESEDIEDQDAEKEAPFEEAGVKQATEAKKDIEGSLSTEKGMQAPKPKNGAWEEINVAHAADAKKHIEGTTSDDKGTQTPKPKEGAWEEKSKKAPEATKAVESGKSTSMATDKAKVVTENFGEEDGEEEEKGDDWEKPETDDDSMEAEPTAKDIKNEVPPALGATDDDDTAPIPAPKAGGATILFSPSTGTYWIKGPGLPLGGTKVPNEFLDIASDNSKKASERASMILKQLENAEDNGMEGDEDIDEGLFGNNNAKKEAKASEFDQINAKLVGTKGDQTRNKEKWLERAKQDNYRGSFMIDRGVLVYDANHLMPSTGAGGSFGTASE